ncbi:MAG TPA: endonuclease/exonuclease/phosphatase family protein [Phototrophicaceae bacterium]|nr:endonuclease/exonuclease/phosphatase family protein [Phototrophicaceae bacterium]
MIVCGVYTLALVVYLALRLLFGDGFWWLGLLNTFAHLLFLPLLVLLPLALLIRARGAALRLLPLVVVAGLWFGPYYLPKAPPEAVGDTIRVATFNMRVVNNDLSLAETWIKQLGADIVCLQEIPLDLAESLLARLHEHFPYQAVQDDIVRWVGYPSQNAILSRYSIVQTDTVDLQADGTALPVRAVLDVNGQLIAVYNVHLAWPSGGPRLELPVNNYYLNTFLGFDDRIRNQQIMRLLAHLQTEPYAYLIAGDFNTSSSSGIYQQLAAAMHDSFREIGAGFGGTWPVSEVLGLPGFVPPFLRLDYIWHSDQFQAVSAQVGPRLGSDHLPLLVTLAFLADG